MLSYRFETVCFFFTQKKRKYFYVHLSTNYRYQRRDVHVVCIEENSRRRSRASSRSDRFAEVRNRYVWHRVKRNTCVSYYNYGSLSLSLSLSPHRLTTERKKKQCSFIIFLFPFRNNMLFLRKTICMLKH